MLRHPGEQVCEHGHPTSSACRKVFVPCPLEACDEFSDHVSWREVVPVRGAHQRDAAGLLGDRNGGLGHVGEAPDSMCEIVGSGARADTVVEVDDPDRLGPVENRVVRSEVTVSDDLAVARERRVLGRVVEITDEVCRAAQSVIGQVEWWPTGGNHPLDEGDHLPILMVVPSGARSA